MGGDFEKISKNKIIKKINKKNSLKLLKKQGKFLPIKVVLLNT